MSLVAIFGLLITSVIFAYTVKIPIMYIFSGVIAFATALYAFNYHATGAESHEAPTFIMYGYIFISVGVWQLGEAIREYIR